MRKKEERKEERRKRKYRLQNFGIVSHSRAALVCSHDSNGQAAPISERVDFGELITDQQPRTTTCLLG
jgi:hypothetical protein